MAVTRALSMIVNAPMIIITVTLPNGTLNRANSGN